VSLKGAFDMISQLFYRDAWLFVAIAVGALAYLAAFFDKLAKIRLSNALVANFQIIVILVSHGRILRQYYGWVPVTVY
jgi:hypothetical protein